VKVEAIHGTIEVVTTEGKVTIDLNEHAVVIRDEEHVLFKHRLYVYSIRNKLDEALRYIVDSFDKLTRG